MKKLALLLVAGLLFFGCRTNGVLEDSFPQGIKAEEARAQAVKNYTAHYGTPGRMPLVKVFLSDVPPAGHGAYTQSSGKGYRIVIWKDQTPFYGSLVHEFEHALKMANGKGGKEGW